MSKTVEIEVFVLVDSCGDYSAAVDAEKCKEAYENDIQSVSDCECFRMVKVKISIQLPEIAQLCVSFTEDQTEPVVSVS